MYSELRVVSSPDLTKRSYISFYFNGKRVREFNGNNLGLDIKPNLARTIQQRDKLLRKLEYELLKALENDAYPAKPQLQENVELVIPLDAVTLLQRALDSKINSNYSNDYKKNMKLLHRHFIQFLTPIELASPITDIKSQRIEQFLSRYKSSGTYYMDKRRELGVLFSAIGKELDLKLTAVLRTDRMKIKAKLHKIYRRDQLQPILSFLSINHENLYLCCLLSYGCFLRPHKEVRNLCLHHFKKDFTEIHLSGDENKSGRIRIVPVPQYVREALIPRVKHLEYDENIFSAKKQPFNEAYFSTAWKRMWNLMYKENLVERNQTMYSFRHTAAVFVYRKTKDVHVVQQVLGHSDMIVTLKYLRGLGELNLDDQKQYMPEL